MRNGERCLSARGAGEEDGNAVPRAGGAGRAAPQAGWVGGVAAHAQALGRPDPRRAKQFMPFAALRGYYELIRRKERVPEERRELTEEACEKLSRVLAAARKGDMLRVTHYDRDAYVTTTGVLTRLDPVAQTLTIVKGTIRFSDLLAVRNLAHEGAAAPQDATGRR